jgi:hypothetical protein
MARSGSGSALKLPAVTRFAPVAENGSGLARLPSPTPGSPKVPDELSVVATSSTESASRR